MAVKLKNSTIKKLETMGYALDPIESDKDSLRVYADGLALPLYFKNEKQLLEWLDGIMEDECICIGDKIYV
jgi:hypothetical protein